MLSYWKISAGVQLPILSSKHCLSGYRVKTDIALRAPYCSLRIPDIDVGTPEPQFQHKLKNDKHASVTRELRTTKEDPHPGISPESFAREGGDEGVSGIQVPRQRYISISKAELLDAIVKMFESQEEIDQFLLLSSCFDSILHAEHKSILEEMRSDYNLHHLVEKKGTCSGGLVCSESKPLTNCDDSASAVENTIAIGSMAESKGDRSVRDMAIGPSFRLDLSYILGSSPKNFKRNSLKESRVAIATRFQRAFVQLLYNAQFEELSARDLMLTSTLNSDYLLTLPIYVDWKRAYESNAIIFRRGYATERQKGLLIVEKLDYLQSKLLQEIFFIISKPLGKVGTWITEVLTSANMVQDLHVWAERIRLWLKELTLFQQSNSYNEQTADNMLDVSQLSEDNLPIWLAAQRAVTRYEGILSPVGPRGRLLRKLLTWIGLIPFTPKKPFELESEVTTSEPYLRPISLSRITLSDIWEPATRKCCGNDLWKMLKTAVSILFSKSVLQEPAFQELILLFTKERDHEETEDKAEVPLLQLKIYEKISIPDLPVIFPHKKLSFRILDTVRLDAATVLGLLAYFINYKFEDILSSPSAILLDVIAISALIIYVIRVALGYKQTWDRYQLLVNKTLYEKTLASGFGSVHFLLDASEQQQYKESILAYAILLKTQNIQATCPENVKDKCERFMYNVFKKKVEMPVDKAIDTLKRLGLVIEKIIDHKTRLQAIPCSEAYNILKQHWDSLLN